MVYLSNRDPDFLIIGAMKAGTTSLAQALSIHPEIYITNPKEIHFFNRDDITSENLQEYRSNFKSSKRIKGSAPQDYSKIHQKCNSKTAFELRKWLPNVKLIYLVREPVSRMKSHFLERHAHDMPGVDSLAFHPETDLWNHCKMTSSYGYQLQEYLNHFDESQIHVLRLENILKNSTEEFQKIFDFLQVEMIEVKFPKANSSNEKYFLRFAEIYPMMGDNRVSRWLIQLTYRIGMRYSCAKSILLQPAYKPEMEESVLNSLHEFFRCDASKLRGTKFFDTISYYR